MHVCDLFHDGGDPTLAWQAQADQLFDAGLDIEPQRREAWLDEQEVEDPAIRAEVLDLFAKAEAPVTLLDPDAFAHGPLIGEALAPSGACGEEEAEAGEISFGSQIGPWRILERLGQGGMGTVYRAERADGAFELKAALKWIRSDVWSVEICRRLEAERQILADLDHPNIARLLDGGTAPGGRPYLVMELVEGVPIDQHCDDLRLSIDRRLQLFRQVCLAVQHAHRALVVHRDLKPSNVVVAAGEQVKLLDFGIARALSGFPGHTPQALRRMPGPSEPLTQAADRLMTPEYASPEQVLGESVTTATDVYQLGLLLFELLTGQRAQQFRSPWPVALVHVVCDKDAPRLSGVAAGEAEAAARSLSPQALVRRLRGDLDAIVAKALRKEPEQRYGSVAELVEDLDRHRLGLPVSARATDRPYRLGRWFSRHRRGLLGAALISALLIWIGAVSLQSSLRALQEAERVRQVETVIGSLFEYPRSTPSGRRPEVKDFVDHAAQLIRTHLREQPTSRAHLLSRLGRTYSSLGSYREAVSVQQEALGLLHRSASSDRSELLFQLARNQHFAGAFAEAEQSFRGAEALSSDIRGADHPDTVAVRLSLADLLHSLGRLRESQDLLERQIETLNQSSERSSRTAGLLAQARGFLGNVLRDRGLVIEAEVSYLEAVAGMREVFGVEDPRTASHSIHFSRLLAMSGRWQEAESRLKTELETLRRVHHGEHPLSATALRELAYAAIKGGELDLADEHLEKAYEVSLKWFPSEHPTIPRIKAIEAELELRRGDPGRAVTISKQALELFDHLGLRAHPSALDACGTLDRALGVSEPRPAWASSFLESCREGAERAG